MNLTLKGFLRGYCRELTGLQTDNLRKLLGAVLGNAPTAAETVMAFAAVQGKGDYLAGLAEGTLHEDDYRAFAQLCTECGGVEEALQSSAAAQRYRKVWDAYLARHNAIQADRRVIACMREKTLKALEGSGRTVYSLCTELNLNKGNVYAYLNGGDVTKVSRSTARRVMDAACRLESIFAEADRIREASGLPEPSIDEVVSRC